MAAESERFVRKEYPGVQVPSEAGWHRVGERRLRALGAGDRLVQQYRVERWSIRCQTISNGDGTLRMEQAVSISVGGADGVSFMEAGVRR